MKTRTTLSARFWSKVEKRDGCWEWTGAVTAGGYGVVQRGTRAEGLARAHRVSWELHFGPIVDGLHVCHACDNPRCVRPDHLFLGTPAVNADDRGRKGRTRTGVTRGQAHHNAKLTMPIARRIRATHAAGVSLNRIAAEVGVSKKTVLNVVQHRIWRED